MKTLRVLFVLAWAVAAAAASVASPDGVTRILAQGSASLTPSAAPLNPRFLAHISRHSTLNAMGVSIGESVNYGLVPEPFIMPKMAAGVTVTATGALPASYDLRTMGKLSPVKNQGNCGSCWACAAYGSLESCLLPGGLWDLSEINFKNRHGFDLSCCGGGDRAMATAYLARWDGPMSESDDSYSVSTCTSPTSPTPRKHVQDVVFIPDRSGPLDNDALKAAVMQYGAIYTSFYYGGSYYNAAKYAYYCPNVTEGNHAVCIVGWDDH